MAEPLAGAGGRATSQAMAMVLLPALVELRGEALTAAWRGSWPAAPPLQVSGDGQAMTA